MRIEITDEAKKALSLFSMPEALGFGTVMAPIMLEANYKNGMWHSPLIIPYGPLSLDPAAKVLHYAQEIFEGLKAYKNPLKAPHFFRPLENFKRFNFSARRMAMPEVPEHIWMNGVQDLTRHLTDFIPTNDGESLYIRPFMIATQAHIGIKPSTEFKFLIIASPSEAYFTSGSVKVFIQRKYVRAVKGGTGNAKFGGNYAAAMLSSEEAFRRGYQQSLWLDAIEKRYIEELSGMNFFTVVDGELWTPKITETILKGITRKSVIELAKHLDINVREESIEIDTLLKWISEGKASEAFACGTAAIICPINSLSDEDGSEYIFTHPEGKLAQRLRNHLLEIQQGKADDHFNWIHSLEL